MGHHAPSLRKSIITQIFRCIFVQIASLTFSRNGSTMSTTKRKEVVKMTVEELITALLKMPMDAEIVTSYSVEDDDGEEYIIEDSPIFIKKVIKKFGFN